MDSRFSQLLITVILVSLLFIGFRPKDLISGMPEDQFWVNKMFWNQQFDMVFAGDSRMNRGVSPAIVNEFLVKSGYSEAHEKMANFGFNACGLTKEYLDHVEHLLDPALSKKVIVLGITPLSLSPKSHVDNNFIRLNAMSQYERYETKYVNPYLYPFRQIDLYYMLNGTKEGYFSVNYPDGWTESWLIPEDPMQAIENYKDYFVENKVSPELMKNVLTHVKHWKSQGIKVFGLFPPTSLAMKQLQSKKSGLDESKFIGDFTAAGGTWLKFDDARYHSYDGSHLRNDSARQFSEDLAKAMLPHLKIH